MARNLIRAGLRVDVWDRRPEATGRLTEAGATAYVGPDKAVAHANVVITMLPDAAAVTSVAIGQGMLAALRQGTIWAQMGTIGVRATQQLAASVADQRSDVLFVDAPVSGTRQPAKPAASHPRVRPGECAGGARAGVRRHRQQDPLAG